jgi:hypothetical protein
VRLAYLSLVFFLKTLAAAENEKNKERSDHKTSHQHPATPLPQGG